MATVLVAALLIAVVLDLGLLIETPMDFVILYPGLFLAAWVARGITVAEVLLGTDRVLTQSRYLLFVLMIVCTVLLWGGASWLIVRGARRLWATAEDVEHAG